VLIAAELERLERGAPSLDLLLPVGDGRLRRDHQVGAIDTLGLLVRGRGRVRVRIRVRVRDSLR